jgi:preprotein translocase subunit Sec61beta
MCGPTHTHTHTHTQVTAILERAGIVSFWQVLDLAGPTADPVAVLELLKKSAVLVRGNWVPKTAQKMWVCFPVVHTPAV